MIIDFTLTHWIRFFPPITFQTAFWVLQVSSFHRKRSFRVRSSPVSDSQTPRWSETLFSCCGFGTCSSSLSPESVSSEPLPNSHRIFSKFLSPSLAGKTLRWRVFLFFPYSLCKTVTLRSWIRADSALSDLIVFWSPSAWVLLHRLQTFWIFCTVALQAAVRCKNYLIWVEPVRLERLGHF